MSTQRRRPLRWTIGLVVSVALIVVFAPTTVGGPTSYVIVSGSSMSPTLAEGDLVVVRRGHYEVGDIVAFQTGNGLVIHRIVDGSAEEGFVMQGDNKAGPDTWTPLPDDIVGEYFAHVPQAGRWVNGLASNPGVFAAMIGGLGSLMIWSPRRRRRRHGAHSAEVTRRRAEDAGNVVPARSAGVTLVTLAVAIVLLTTVTVWLMVRPMQRTMTVDRVLFEYQGEFAYTASVEDSVVYDSETVTSPASGSAPTGIYTQLLDELVVEFRYTSNSRPSPGTNGTVATQLRVGAGDGLWTRTIALIDPYEFDGSSTSVSFPLDVERILRMVARAEEETGYSPGLYHLAVIAKVRFEPGAGDASGEVVEVELPMELSGTLLSIVNDDLRSNGIATQPEEQRVPNDLEILGLSVSTRLARATFGALLAMTLLGGVIYAVGVRRRLGSGELARIRLRYGSLIVPVSEMTPNGQHAVQVKTMADLVRLARRAEQMVFYHRDGASRHRFFVPDGAVTYEYRSSGAGEETR
jgi:signal peptidase